VERDPKRAAALLDDVVSQANEAQATIRELARGIFPPLLADRGVAAALGAQVTRVRPSAELRVDASVAALRFEPGVEAGVYFCCLGALQNVSKHAPDARVAIHLDHDGQELRFSVHDDGPGFDSDARPAGSGLQNMADRIAAIGGSIEVVSSPGHGTSVAGRVPALPIGQLPSRTTLEPAR
jgi:signal transduction histidine kinase